MMNPHDITRIASAITAVTQDSRLVEKGGLFAALPGSKDDGRAYIKDAIRNGAKYVLAANDADLPDNGAEIEWIKSDNPRLALSLIAAAYYKAQPETVAAVTGTSGKTSVAHFLRQLWEALDYASASLGTLGVQSRVFSRYGSLTTPDPVKLHAELADLSAAGVTHLALEASSHGLHQYRLDGVKIGAAGFTNLSRDHLDYHATMEDYFAAKARLFTEVLAQDGTAVINADNPEGQKLIGMTKARGAKVIDYGQNAQVLKIIELRAVPEGFSVDVAYNGGNYALSVPFAAEFQIENMLCALGLALAGEREEKNIARLFDAAGTIEGAPGRLQYIPGHPQGAAIYVDYAHKPDALEKALQTLRPHVKGRLFCVVGCGGDRDPGKRPMMGRIGAELADVLIVTDDNPRSEDPALIRQAMMEAARDVSPDAMEIGDRAEAISAAIQKLEAGDVLVIAGKGHEQGQIIQGTVHPFDDCDAARAAMNRL